MLCGTWPKSRGSPCSEGFGALNLLFRIYGLQAFRALGLQFEAFGSGLAASRLLLASFGMGRLGSSGGPGCKEGSRSGLFFNYLECQVAQE